MDLLRASALHHHCPCRDHRLLPAVACAAAGQETFLLLPAARPWSVRLAAHPPPRRRPNLRRLWRHGHIDVALLWLRFVDGIRADALGCRGRGDRWWGWGVVVQPALRPAGWCDKPGGAAKAQATACPAMKNGDGITSVAFVVHPAPPFSGQVCCLQYGRPAFLCDLPEALAPGGVRWPRSSGPRLPAVDDEQVRPCPCARRVEHLVEFIDRNARNPAADAWDARIYQRRRANRLFPSTHVRRESRAVVVGDVMWQSRDV